MPPRLRSFFTSGLTFALYGMAAISLFTFLARWLWLADLITPFRVQIAVATLIIATASWAWGERQLKVIATLVAVLILAPIGVRLISLPALPSPTTSPHRPVSLVMSNVLYKNQDHDAANAMVAREDPDIFAAVEAGDDWISSLEGLSERYPYHYAIEGRGAFGISLHAKAPFTVQVLTPGHADVPLLRAEFADFILLVAHPVPPVNADWSVQNTLYLKALAQQVRDAQKPVIITGDLNATLWSHSLTPLIEAKMQRPAGSGFAHTWPVGNKLLAIQIDHVLTRDIPAARFKTLPTIGSDHFPIRADIDLGPKP